MTPLTPLHTVGHIGTAAWPSVAVPASAPPGVGAAEQAIQFAAPHITDDEISALVKVMCSGWLTTGVECAELERELARYLGAAHAVGVASCTAALETCFAYLNLAAGARVGVSTWTFVASALAAARHGAVPVLLDIDSDTLNLSPDALAEALDEGLDALVAVHFGGVPVAPEVHDLCAQAGVPVVEDAAHALGAQDRRGRIAGQGSVAACYSFYASKNLTCGEGGAVVTDDPGLDAFARSYRLHGLSRDAYGRYAAGGRAAYDLLHAGIKANLPDVLATVARAQLRRFDAMQSHRRALVQRYRDQLTGIPGLRIVPKSLASGSADHLMVVALPHGVDRESVVGGLGAEGIPTSVHFRPLHHFTWFQRHAELGPGGAPMADALAERVLSLPLHPGLRLDEVDRVCDRLRHVLSP